jgi:hypothetical protein
MLIVPGQILFLEGSAAFLENDERASRAFTEVEKIFSLIDGKKIKEHFEQHATNSVKSVSTTVTQLTVDAFQNFGWEFDWVIFKSESGAKETLFLVKDFAGLCVGLEIGSRHKSQMMATFFKANLATRRPSQPNRRHIDLYLIGAYFAETIQWGKWNSAVSSFEAYEVQSEMVDGALAHPTIIFGLGQDGTLDVGTNLSGTLKLTLRNS